MRVRTARIIGLLSAIVALAAGGTVLAGPARADGDPASDILLGTDVFYPYTPVSQAAETALDTATAALRRDRAPIKIALIASPTDLGVIPTLFDHPQQYATFLDTEISFEGPQPLLVVMPSGYGVSHLTPAVARVVAALPKPAGAGAGALAGAALTAVDRIAAAEAHPIAGAPVFRARSSAGGSPILVIGLVVVALLAAGALVATTLRRRHPAA